jgi:hypothetical protein
MRFRCDQIRESDQAQCVLTKMHVGIVACKFDREDKNVDIPHNVKHSFSEKRRTKAEILYGQILEMRRVAGEIKKHEYESIKLKIGAGVWYLPDYYIVNSLGLVEIHEVKSHHRFKEKGILKLKVAALAHPHYHFFLALYDRGRWDIQRIMP